MSDIRNQRKINPLLQLRRAKVADQQAASADVDDFDEVSPNLRRKDAAPINRGAADRLAARPARTTAQPAQRTEREQRPERVERPTRAQAVETPREARAEAGTAQRVRRVNPAFVTDEPDGEVEAPQAPQAAQTPVERPRVRRVNPLLADPGMDEDEPVETPEERAPRRTVNPRFAVDEDESKPQRGERARSAFPTQNRGGFQRPAARPGARVVQRNFVPKYRQRPDAPLAAEDWTDDESNDPQYGLGSTRETNRRKPRYDKAVRLSDRDYIVIKFLARYRYAWTTQLARLLDTTPESIAQRLRKLEGSGFIRKQPITEKRYLWMSTKAGNILVNCPFPEIKKGSLSPATIQHTIGLASLAIELEREAGGKDILGERKDDEDGEPAMNRYKLGIWGHEKGKGYGEMTVSEREIRQGQLRWRGGRTTKDMRELVDLAIAAPAGIEAQELLEGNEGLFVVYGANNQEGEHIPDLVVARERGPENEVQHIAIELELTGKPFAEWKRILRWYRDNGVMYDKYYYFTNNRGIATALRRVDEEVGLGDRLVIRKYNPKNPDLPFWG